MSFMQATTIVGVYKEGRCALAGDGQVTQGQAVIMKSSAVKVRRIYDGKVIIGFAGSVADAFSLSDLFEAKLQEYSGNLFRAAVELAKLWRSDKILRKLEAMMIAADHTGMLVLSGTGEVIVPDDGVAAIGSGGTYALAAARALMKHTSLSAPEIAKEAITIAGDICVYTNHFITVEEIARGKEA